MAPSLMVAVNGCAMVTQKWRDCQQIIGVAGMGHTSVRLARHFDEL